MSVEQFAGLLIQTAVVYRRRQVNGADKKDRFGQPTQDEQPIHLLACRYSTPSGSTQMAERSRDVIMDRGKLFLDAGADLKEDDVVTVIGYPVTEVDIDDLPTDRVIEERAQVDFAADVYDGVGPHHREVKLVSQRGGK